MNNALDMKTMDLVESNIAKLLKLFPNIRTELPDGKIGIDFDVLKQEISFDIMEGAKERYRLEWPGKRESIVLANLPTTKTLRPSLKDSVNFPTTENLFIEGDNLDVLKLLQESYLSKVKVIYIDPPYNTGKDFVYKDNFTSDTETFNEESGQIDEFNRRLIANPETSGRYHSDWLSMMYPRLKLGRNLLSEDGLIFISIDGHEVTNLRKICNEVFGESNYVQEIIWQRHAGGGNDSRYFAVDHEYILCFAKNIDAIKKLRLPLSEKDIAEYKSKDQHFDKLGPYKTKSFLRMRPDDPRPGLQYEITCPDGTKIFNEWKWEQPSFLAALKQDKVIIRKDEKSKWTVEYKLYLNDEEGDEKKKVPRSMFLDEARNSQGKQNLTKILGKANIFNNPKPVELIKTLINIGAQPHENAIILDFFGGSGTTAQAVLELNNVDEGNRKFILVQVPEQVDEKSDAYKAGYKTISEIAKARILKVANQFSKSKADNGVRIFWLDESNMNDVYYRPQDYSQTKIDMFADNIKEDRTGDDLIAQVILDWGLPLSLKIQELIVQGKKVFKVAENSLFACFDKTIDESFAKEIAKHNPLRMVFRDSSFKDDTAKENVKQLLKQLSPETEMRVI